MNKKLQNGLVMAVSAAMGTGIVAPIIAAAATTGTNLDAQYAEAYNATVKATASKDQKDLTAARVLVDGLYQAVKGTKAEYLATTLSSLLDPAQQVKLNDLYAAMAKADGSLKQADINASRDLLLAMPQQWITTFSSANDAIQQKLIAKVNAAVVTAETSKSGLDKIAAMALVNDVKTATNNADVVAWANAMVTRVNAVVAKVAVTNVTASDTMTLVFTGSGLENLTKDAITIPGYTVDTVKPSTDGLSATVTLTTGILPNKEYTVTVNGTDSKFTYGLVVKTVAVNAVTVDEELENQALTLNINGANVSVDSLKAAGYEVTFAALDGNVDATNTLFANNTTGDINLGLTLGKDYKVMATVYRGTDVVVSDYATVSVRNINQVATAINKYTTKITNGVGTFTQKSTTFVTGETAQVTSLNITANGETLDVTPAVPSITSSNPGVISVNAATGIITANTPGTATLTLSYGGATKAVTYTVTGTARKLGSVAASSTSVSYAHGLAVPASSSVTLTAYDQYGDLLGGKDLYATHTAGVVTTLTSLPTLIGTTSVVAGSTYGQYALTLTEAAVGSGNVYIQDNKGNVFASIAVTVTSNNVQNNTKLEVVKDSTGVRSNDTTLDINDDSTVQFALNNYNSNGVWLSSTPATGYYAVFNGSVVKFATAVGDTTVLNAQTGHDIVAGDLVGGNLALTAVGKGTTDVAIYKDSTMSSLVAKTTITVADSSPSITGVAFKTVPTVSNTGAIIKASTVLQLTTGVNSDLVTGVTLSSPSGHAVRVVNSGANAGLLFIDRNDDGKYNNVAGDDYALGMLQEVVASDFTPITSAIVTTAITDAYTGTAKTVLGDKGTIIFKIVPVDSTTGVLVAGSTSVLASTSVSVNVK